MSRNRDTVDSAFERWRAGSGYVAEIFDDDSPVPLDAGVDGWADLYDCVTGEELLVLV